MHEAEPREWEACPICRASMLCAHRPVVAPAAWQPRRLMATIHDRLQQATDPAIVQWALASRRQPRAAGLIGPEQIRAAAVLLLTLPGTPTIVSGDEIGLSDRATLAPLRRRHAHLERAPMVWDDTNANGFARWPWRAAGEFPRVDSVGVQRCDPDSILVLYRRLIALRHNERALQVGAFSPLLANDRLLVYLREAPGNRVLVAMNLGTESAAFSLRPELRGHYALCTERSRESGRAGTVLEMSPGEAIVLRLAGS
ncbi:MAG: DUF3459 domain-containing protein [Thermomicrobiales bacterium]|nr:DUF3459 domain-containing protein [Thermomicrobiales bacterium]